MEGSRATSSIASHSASHSAPVPKPTTLRACVACAWPVHSRYIRAGVTQGGWYRWVRGVRRPHRPTTAATAAAAAAATAAAVLLLLLTLLHYLEVVVRELLDLAFVGHGREES